MWPTHEAWAEESVKQGFFQPGVNSLVDNKINLKNCHQHLVVVVLME